MKLLKRKSIGVLSATLGLAGLATAALSTRFHFLGIGVALVFFFISATIFSKANQIAHSLAPFVKRSVRVEVWGAPLPGARGDVFEIDSIRAISAGLHIFLRPASGGLVSRLKVAQPRSASVEEGRIEISEAAYVSWAGTKLKRAVGAKMPAVVLNLA